MVQLIKTFMRTDIITNSQTAAAKLLSLIQNQQDLTVNCIYATWSDALHGFKKYLPEILLVNTECYNDKELQAIRQLKAFSPSVKIVVLSLLKEKNQVFQYFKEGADGFLFLDAPLQELQSKLSRIRVGGVAVSEEVIKWLVEKNHLVFNPELTSRENEVIRYVAEGKTSTEIADLLYLSPFTIKTHLSNIYHKLGCKKKSELISRARMSGWVS